MGKITQEYTRALHTLMVSFIHDDVTDKINAALSINGQLPVYKPGDNSEDILLFEKILTTAGHPLTLPEFTAIITAAYRDFIPMQIINIKMYLQRN